MDRALDFEQREAGWRVQEGWEGILDGGRGRGERRWVEGDCWHCSLDVRGLWGR